MRTVQLNIYTFNELSDKAKQNARDWWLEGYVYEDNFSEEDMKQIGLGLNEDKKFAFLGSAPETMELIFQNHGPSCNSYQYAKAYGQFLEDVGVSCDLPDSHPKRIEWEEKRESIDNQFLVKLAQYYVKLIEDDYQYNISNEVVDGLLIANEYEFTEDGKIYKGV